MENSQISSLTKVMLNISTSKDQGLNLVKGEILRGVVQAVRSDGLVSLFIKGQVIEAASEVLVQSGQQLHLMVEEFRDGRAYLKVLTPQVMDSIENTNLSANLIDMGVPAKEGNVMMAKKLLHYNLPVTTANLNELSKAMNMLGGANPRNLEIGAFALARGVPLNPSSLDSLARFTTGGSALNQLVEDIFNRLAQLVQSDNINTEKFITQEGSGSKNITAQPIQESSQVSSQTSASAEKAAVQQPPALTQKAAPEAAPQIKVTDPATGEQTPISGKASGSESSAPPNRISVAELLETVKETPGAKTAPAGENPASAKPTPSAGEKIAISQDSQGGEKTQGDKLAGTNEKNPPAQSNQTGGKPVEEPKAAAGNQKANAAAIPAGKGENPAAAEQTAGNLKAGSGESTSFLNKSSSVQLTQSGEEVPAGKTIPAGERAEGQRTNLIPAAKTTIEPAPQTGAKTGNEQTAPPAGKVAQAPPQQDSGKVLENVSPANVKPAITEDGNQVIAPKNTPISQPESNPGTVLNKGGDNPTKSPSLEPALGGQGEKLFKYLDLLRPLLEVLKIDANDNKAAMGTKLETSIKTEGEIIKGLILLEDILKNDPTASRTPLINDLLQKITGLEKELSGQHILNAVSRTTVDSSMNFYYFSFPVQIENEIHLGQLRISKEIGRKGLKNQENIKFIVSLDTERMGLVLFHVDWKRTGKLEIQGVVENQTVYNHLTRNIDQLLQGLNDLGYDTKNLGIKIIDENDKPGNLRISLEDAPLNLRPLGIDITV